MYTLNNLVKIDHEKDQLSNNLVENDHENEEFSSNIVKTDCESKDFSNYELPSAGHVLDVPVIGYYDFCRQQSSSAIIDNGYLKYLLLYSIDLC